jgi:hypothetical protein
MRAAQHFNALDVLRRQRREIECAARFIQRHPVEQDFVVRGFATAHEHARQVADATGANGDHAGDRSEEVDRAQRVPLLDLIAIEHRNRRANLRFGHLTARCGDDDGLVDCGRRLRRSRLRVTDDRGDEEQECRNRNT